MMKLEFIFDKTSDATCAFRKTCQRICLQLTILQSTLVHAYRRQQRKLPRVADFKKPIEMPVLAIHLMTSLAPFDAAGLSEIAVGYAILLNRRVL